MRMVGGNKFALDQIANFDCGLSNCEFIKFQATAIC